MCTGFTDQWKGADFKPISLACQRPLNRLQIAHRMRLRTTAPCLGGEIGRRAGFKIQFLYGSVGSIPTPGTIHNSTIMSQPSEQNPEPRRTAAAPAGIARRLGALVYDSLLILAIWMMTALVAVLISGEAVNPVVMQLISVAEVIAFYGYFWADRGQTLGMRAWRLVLVDSEGNGVSWPAIARRMLVGPFSLLIFGLGYLWYFVGTRQQTWHDRFSDTYVVLVPKET